MATINLERVEQTTPVIFSIVISRRQKSESQLRRESDLDETFDTDVATDVIYHRANGTIVNLRGWLREDYFEVDPGSESQVGDNTIILRIPSHRFYFTVNNEDWIEVEGLRYNVILSKRSMGGTTTLLLHLK